jgi:hypothetical protein
MPSDLLFRKLCDPATIEIGWHLAHGDIRAVKEKGYTHLTKTDITAYFENIELSVLETALRNCLRSDPTIIEILMRIIV